MSIRIPGTTATIDDEQRFFDSAWDAREAARAARGSAWQQVANAKDRARLKANADSDTTLGDPEDSVAFLRIDTEDGDAYYVGEHSISDDDNEKIVLSWKSPAMLRLRGATHDDRRGVTRHRTFSTVPINRIREIDDVVLAELARQVAQLRAPESELMASDSFLQSELARARTPQMQTIVRTIQAAQADVIGAPHDVVLVVQGGPGTGKTAVALHRVAALLYGPLQSAPRKDVLVVGPNPTFLRYIARVLPELGERDVVQAGVGQLMGTGAQPTVVEKPAVARLKGDARMADVLSRGLADRIQPPRTDVRLTFTDSATRATLTAEAMAEVLAQVDRFPYLVGRARLRDLLESEAFVAAQAASRFPRFNAFRASLGDQKKRPRPLPGGLEALVESIWPTLTPAAFLRDLLGSAERLEAAAGQVLSTSEMKVLKRRVTKQSSAETWSPEDLPLLDHVAFAMTGECDTYAHVVVDEVQDLSPMQLRALRRRSRHGAMTLVGDVAQSTGPWARDSWDDVLGYLDSPLETRRVELRYGYRVPRAVMEFAARLLPAAAPGVTAPTVVREVRDCLHLHARTALSDRCVRVADIARRHSDQGRFVGVICPDECRDDLAEALRRARVQWTDADEGGLTSAVNVVSPGGAKGLEFDALVVLDPATIVDSGPHGLRMLYVALTRTTAYLDVVHAPGRLPRPLGGAGSDPELPAQRSAETAPETVSPARTVASTETSAPPVRARRRSATTSTHQRVVGRHAERVLEVLTASAPAELWQEILTEAQRVVEQRPRE